MAIEHTPRIVFEVRILKRGMKRIVHGTFASKHLALMIADAQSRQVAIPGVVEVWECQGDRETMIRAYPGKV